MVSTAMMGIAELAQFLVASGTYSTVADAMAALNLVIVDGAGAAGTAIAVSGGAAQTAIGTIGETALEVAAEAELAATGTNVSTAGIGLLQGSGGSGVAAGLLGVDVGIIGAAVAPILGVSLGAGMYESNPEFWTALSQRLLPFCYPDTTVIPTWAEVGETAWETCILKDIIDAVKEFFDEEGISSGYPTPSESTPGTYTEGGSVLTVVDSLDWADSSELARERAIGDVTGALVWNVDSLNGGISVGTVTIYSNGTARGAGRYLATRRLSDGLHVDRDWSASATVDYSASGTHVDLTGHPGTYYPEGTSEWQGTTPSEIPQGKPAVIDWDHSTQSPVTKPTVPISIPQDVPDTWIPGQPCPSADPEVQPDPTTTTNPTKQVQPYIQPLPIPWSITNPEQQTEADPTLDPTRPRKPTQTIEQPPIELGPEPTGLAPIPLMPTTDLPFDLSQGVGLVTVYHPTDAQLYAFERWLWVTYADATIDKIWNNPFDGIIGLFELYCTPTDVGTQHIRSGFLDSGIDSAVISRYTYIDCGTLGIPEYYGNYLDYSPYSKAHVYLPFIGIQELNVDDIVGHAVNITYRIDEYNGSCIAMITVAKVTEVNGEEVEYSNTMYQFSGNCSVELPITGGSQAAIKAGMMTANAYQNAANISAGANLIGGIGSLLLGSVGGALSGLGQAASSYAYGQANALSNMLSGKSTVQKSGSFGSSHGALGIKVPFITVTRPKQIQVPNYEELYGFPAHKMVTVGSCNGFLRCREVHVISATASDEEKSMIEQLMKSGVYVTE